MTDVLGVIGDPIEHSLSPLMHNKWYERMDIPHHYQAFHLTKEQLEDGLTGVRALGFRGINVTIPHKVSIIQHLDQLNDEAQFLGAVNTVVNDHGHLIGYNTDGRGLVSAILEQSPESLQEASILILGAGGASYGVALTLSKLPGVKRVDLANRTVQKAETLSLKCQEHVESKAFDMKQAESQLAMYSIIINSTPMGMSPDWIEEIPIQLDHLLPQTMCIDLIYNPLYTKWLKTAKAKGAVIMNGLPMLVHQGALSFEHWFGRKPDTKFMIEYLTNYLEEKHVKR